MESLKKSVRESSAALFIAASSSSLLASITVRVLSITGGENVITQCHLGALMNCSTLIVPPIPPLNRGKFADWTTEHNFRDSCPELSQFLRGRSGISRLGLCMIGRAIREYTRTVLAYSCVLHGVRRVDVNVV